MKKFLAILSTGTLLIFGWLMAAPASADELPPPVAWQLVPPATPDDPFAVPQVFAGFYGGADLVFVCETWYQVDVYKPGHPFGTGVFFLSSPSEDAEWLDYDRPFPVMSFPWKYVYGGACESDPPDDSEPPLTPVPTSTPVPHSPHYTG